MKQIRHFHLRKGQHQLKQENNAGHFVDQSNVINTQVNTTDITNLRKIFMQSHVAQLKGEEWCKYGLEKQKTQYSDKRLLEQNLQVSPVPL